MYPMQFFLNGLQATRRHKARFGRANAKFEYRAPNGLHLGRWQYEIKKCYHSGRLSREQISLLQELGFNFRIRVTRGRQWIDDFIEYKRRHRSTDIPSDYRTREGYRLGVWQQNTRQRYRKGKLTSRE